MKALLVVCEEVEQREGDVYLKNPGSRSVDTPILPCKFPITAWARVWGATGDSVLAELRLIGPDGLPLERSNILKGPSPECTFAFKDCVFPVLVAGKHRLDLYIDAERKDSWCMIVHHLRM